MIYEHYTFFNLSNKDWAVAVDTESISLGAPYQRYLEGGREGGREGGKARFKCHCVGKG